MNVAIEITIGR